MECWAWEFTLGVAFAATREEPPGDDEKQRFFENVSPSERTIGPAEARRDSWRERVNRLDVCFVFALFCSVPLRLIISGAPSTRGACKRSPVHDLLE